MLRLTIELWKIVVFAQRESPDMEENHLQHYVATLAEQIQSQSTRPCSF